MSKTNDLHWLEQELAEREARCALDSYSRPLPDGWREMEWDHLASTYPGKQETRWLRKSWKYAVARGLIEIHRRNQFRPKESE